MGFIRELDRLLSPVFLFSLGFLAARRAGDQTKNTYTKCVLAGGRPRLWDVPCDVSLPRV